MATRKRMRDWTYLLINGDTVIGGTDDQDIAEAHEEQTGSSIIDTSDQVEEVEDLREDEEEEEEEETSEDDDEDEEP